MVAGGRRLSALKALATDGVLDAAHPVPCLVVEGDAASSELSLAENVIRIAMHPADQVVAFTQLAESGVTVAAIAARFGISESLVEQRLRLGNAAPELLDAYRADEIGLETLKAFAVTTDHGRQMAVWGQLANQGYRPSARQVKRLLTEERIPANSAMALFVGIDAYEAAGGAVLRDLFADEDESGIWLEDLVLLQKLAMEKLGETVKELGTRWRWATAVPEADWTSLARYGRIQPERAEPTDEETAELERLRTREDELCNLDDEWTEALAEEACAIETGRARSARRSRPAKRTGQRITRSPEPSPPSPGTASFRSSGAWSVPRTCRNRPIPATTTGGNAGDGDGDDATGPVRFQGPSISAPHRVSSRSARPRRARKPGSGSGLPTTSARSGRHW